MGPPRQEEALLRQQKGQPEAARACNHLEVQYKARFHLCQDLAHQSLQFATRDLAAARMAYERGDRPRYLALRRRGLKHESVYIMLRDWGSLWRQ